MHAISLLDEDNEKFMLKYVENVSLNERIVKRRHLSVCIYVVVMSEWL